MTASEQQTRPEKVAYAAPADRGYYDIVVALFVGFLLISGVTAAKLIEGPTLPFMKNPLIFDGCAILFPFTYVLGDVLSEVYGLRRARRAIIVGFVMTGIASLTYLAVARATPVEGFEAWATVLGPVPRIAVAGLAGFFAGQLLNAVVLVRIKERMAEKALWLRLVVSTLVGELADTLLFCIIAFGGTISAAEMVNYTATGYVYKCLVEVVMLPVTYLVIRRLKRAEPTYTLAA